MSKIVRKWFKGETALFFSWLFHWNSDKKWRFHVLVWSKNLKPVVVSLKPGVFGEVGGRRPPTSPKYPRFRWIPPQVFKFLLQTNTWIPPFFCPSFNEYRQEKNKKYVRVSNETIHLLFFDQIFTHEYHLISVNTVSRFSLKKKKNCSNLRWFHKNCSKSKIPWYGDEKIVQVEQFFHHHSRVFLIFNSFRFSNFCSRQYILDPRTDTRTSRICLVLWLIEQKRNRFNA